MDLVGEQDRPTPHSPARLRFGYDLSHARDAFRHGRERDELAIGVLCDHLRDGRFSAARRPPENHRTHASLLDRVTQWFARREEVSLTDDVVERSWAHARRERLLRF